MHLACNMTSCQCLITSNHHLKSWKQDKTSPVSNYKRKNEHPEKKRWRLKKRKSKNQKYILYTQLYFLNYQIMRWIFQLQENGGWIWSNGAVEDLWCMIKSLWTNVDTRPLLQFKYMKKVKLPKPLCHYRKSSKRKVTLDSISVHLSSFTSLVIIITHVR